LRSNGAAEIHPALKLCDNTEYPGDPALGPVELVI